MVSLQPPVLGWASYWNEDLFDGSDFDLLVEPLAVLATAGVVLAGALPLVWPLCPSSSEDDAVKSMSTALGRVTGPDDRPCCGLLHADAVLTFSSTFLLDCLRRVDTFF